MDVRDLRKVHDASILAIVDLAIEELLPELTRELIYCRVPLVDGSSNSLTRLAVAIETTASLIRKKVPTLVACGAGMSRAPSIAAAAIALVRNQSPDKTLQELVAENPHDISPALWARVRIACRE